MARPYSAAILPIPMPMPIPMPIAERDCLFAQFALFPGAVSRKHALWTARNFPEHVPPLVTDRPAWGIAPAEGTSALACTQDYILK